MKCLELEKLNLNYQLFYHFIQGGNIFQGREKELQNLLEGSRYMKRRVPIRKKN